MRFIILGIPRPKQSFRFAVIGKRVLKYQKKEVKQEAGNIRSQIINQLPRDFQPFSRGVHISRCWFVFPPLKSWSKKKLEAAELLGGLFKTTAPDLTDNLMKGLMDAMQGVVFINDSQICQMDDVKKFYGPKPMIEIILEEI